MLFAIYCVDRPHSTELRQLTRPTHLEHMERFRDHVVLAGPLLDTDGETSRGGLLIVDFPDRESAERFAADDPYAKAGLFEAVIVRGWRQVIARG